MVAENKKLLYLPLFLAEPLNIYIARLITDHFLMLMEQKKTRHLLSDLWKNYENVYPKDFLPRKEDNLTTILADALTKDENGRLITALNIHTDIQHITCTNNKIVLVTNIGTKENYFCQIDLSLVDPKSRIPDLSKREREVLSLIAKGNSSTQIANWLFISPDTVRTHRKNLFRKTNVNNVAEFVRKCIEWGLLQLIYFYTIEL